MKDCDYAQEKFDHGTGLKTTAKPEGYLDGHAVDHPLPGHNRPLFENLKEPSENVTNSNYKE